MDINNNQQVNTFLKGMNTDTSDSILENSQYRYAENVRISTNTDNNSGELRLVDGTAEIAEFTDRIIYLTSIRDYIVVITVDTEERWSVHVKNKEKDWRTVFGPCEEPIWADINNPALCGVIRWESNNNIKLYITDDTGNHSIIPIQISCDKWPDEGEAPTEFKALSGYQETPLQSPDVHVSLSLTGTLNPAKVQYAYRLFKTGGAATTLSPLSRTLSLRKDTQGYSYSEITDKAVDISINVSNNTYLDQILLFRINYILNGQAPTIHKICEKPMNIRHGGIFKYVDSGTNIELYGISEFLSLISMQIYPSIIESKGDTLFAANLKYTQDSVDKLFEDYDTRSFSSGNYWKLHNPQEEEDAEQEIEFEFPTEEAVANGGILVDKSDIADLCHKLFTDNTDHTYNEEWWHPHSTVAATGYNPNKIGGSGTNIDWELSYNPIQFDNETGNIQSWGMYQTTGLEKGPRTYKHDEVYRFGIILYDLKGRASSVKWICDVHIPPLKNEDIQVGAYATTMRQYYVKFTIKNKPEGCSAYQIVQCPRTMGDRHVLTQGIVGRPYRPIEVKNGAWEYSDYLCPTGLMTMLDMVADNITSSTFFVNIVPFKATTGINGIVYENTQTSDSIKAYKVTGLEVNVRPLDELMASSVQDVIQFASPEYVYLPDDIKDILNTFKSQIQIEHVTAYDTPSDGVSAFATHDSYVSSRQSVNSTMSFRYRLSTLQSFLNTPTISDTTNYTFLQSDVFVVGESVDGWNSSNQQELGINRRADNSRLLLNDIGDDRFEPEFISYNYIQPSGSSTKDAYNVTYPSVLNISYPDVPEWNDFSNETNIRFTNDVTAIGTYSFVNWSAPLMLKVDMSQNGKLASTFNGTYLRKHDAGADDIAEYTRYQGLFFQPLGTGGKCILFKLSDKLLFGTLNQPQNLRNYCLNPIITGEPVQFAPIHIAKITKPVTPYGGYTKYAIENSTYVGNGYFGTFDDFTQPIDIVVDNGDGFLGIFKYNASHIWKDGTYVQGATKMATVYSVPIESDIDLTAAYGLLTESNSYSNYHIQDKPASFDGYSQEKEAYMYNTAYGQIPNAVTYATASYNEISNFNWDTRIHNSDLKTNGETIDNWLTFKAMNYLDVDSRYGEITSMKLFKDRLLFWQDKAFGIVSSNERTALTDTDNNLIILGNGGILQRFDYISTVYGMKPKQFVSTLSNHNLYFWDGYEKEILAYGESLIPLTTVKGVRNYINEHDETAHPCMFYDNKNKEVVSSVVNKGSIAYSEQIDQFTSIYTYTPLYHTDVFNDMLSATEYKLYLHNIEQDNVMLFGNPAKPLLLYVVNSQATSPKVFDILTFGGRFYGGDDLSNLLFKYNTPLKQESSCTGDVVTNREYDFRLDIPRNNNDAYGGRMRGKTIQCELKSTSNSSDFSLQYIITKYRMSWS